MGSGTAFKNKNPFAKKLNLETSAALAFALIAASIANPAGAEEDLVDVSSNPVGGAPVGIFSIQVDSSGGVSVSVDPPHVDIPQLPSCGGDICNGLERLKTDAQNAPGDAAKALKTAANDTIATVKKANGDTINTVKTAAGDTISTLRKAGSDTITTVQKTANDTYATYVKSLRDTSEQTRKSFNDAVEAGQAIVRYTQREAGAVSTSYSNASKRLSEGKLVDAVWGTVTEPMQASEENFFKATQESSVINQAAQTAAATYGGPAGAAAYAAWATYRATGDANMALRAGVLSAITSQTGGTVASMPSGTAGEILKKAAVAGAIGGLTVAAAGGDDKAVQDAFFKSGSAILVQGATQKLHAYSPKLHEAISAAHCISARDIDCLSNTTYARDVKGKILYDEHGKPRIDPATLDPATYIGKWTGIDPKTDDGKKFAFISAVSKLPKMEAIPIADKHWVVTWTMGKNQTLPHNTPSVVVTYVGKSPVFTEHAVYSHNGAQAGPEPQTHNAGPTGTSYVCPFNGFDRTVTVHLSPDHQGCEAIYKTEKGQQTVWESAHKPTSCAPHVAPFIRHLQNLRIACSPR